MRGFFSPIKTDLPRPNQVNPSGHDSIMALPAFASIESSLSASALAAFANIRLAYGAAVVGAVINRSVARVGEYDLSAERRDHITLARTDATGFTSGQTIAADPTTYSIGDLAAMPRSSWKLDRIDSDDGYLVSWWLK